MKLGNSDVHWTKVWSYRFRDSLFNPVIEWLGFKPLIYWWDYPIAMGLFIAQQERSHQENLAAMTPEQREEYELNQIEMKAIKEESDDDDIQYGFADTPSKIRR
jgi:hypothetical protein